jgi:hypothetical protein
MTQPRRITEAVLGAPEVTIKAHVTAAAQEDGLRKLRALGYRSMSEYLAAIYLIAVYGEEDVIKCHSQRLAGVGQSWADLGPDSAFGGL